MNWPVTKLTCYGSVDLFYRWERFRSPRRYIFLTLRFDNPFLVASTGA
jgi:hypothetical protein